MELVVVNSSFSGWLKARGEVFKVIGDHDSGNLSYGFSDQTGAKYFVKFAPYTNQTAVGFLKNAFKIGCALSHPVLTALCYAIECTDGFAVIYEWVNGETLNEITNVNNDGVRISRHHPESVYHRFKALPDGEIIAVLNQIYDLHQLLEVEGFVSSDWYDGCIIYDFAVQALHVMDLDIYHKGAFINTMGRMYGSTRFMAPEEFVKGALIDYQTTVYHMGATAFELLGTGKSQPAVGFRGNSGLYEVALKAIQPEKSQRYSSVDEFCQAWFSRL